MNQKVLLGLFCICAMAAVVPARTYRGGLVYEDLSKVAPQNEVKSIPPRLGRPSYRNLAQVDLSDEMPPIGDQGGQGSCVSWSMGYYHRTQLEYRERHWDLTDPHHQFSPAFIYNQVNGGADKGSYFEHSARVVCEEGCASMADMPYNQYDFLSWPSESAYSHAIPFRAKTWNWMYVRDTLELANVKQLLANGSTVVLGINCYQNFMNIEQFHNTYCVADRYGPNTFGHGVTMVGYDDTMSTHDGTGAFKLVNSFGTGWGVSGFWWMSYQAVMDAGLSQRYAVFLTDTVGYEPQLLARVRVEHPTRDLVALQFLAGPAGAPLWQASFRSMHMTFTDQPFPNHNLVFDLTEAAPYIVGGQTDSVYFAVRDQSGDGETGAVRYFSAQYLPWGNIYPSADTPLAIPDDGSWVYAGTRVRRFDLDAGPMRVLAPAGVLKADSTYTPQVMVRNFGLSTISFRVLLFIYPGHQDSDSVSNLAPGDSAVVQFDPWTAPGQGTVHVQCATALDGDQFQDNDHIAESARVYYRDIAVVAITSPPDTVDSGQAVWPRARVRNNGTQDETFLMYFRIPDEGYDHWSMARRLPPGQETLVTFTPWTPKLPGYHYYYGQLVASDMDPSNDVLDGDVFVRIGAGVEESPQPQAASSKQLPSVVRGVLFLPVSPFTLHYSLFDMTGRRVMSLAPGPNDVRHLSPGVYFLREQPELDHHGQTVRGVVLVK
ncbi:hypothetical protein JXD38_07820 [candidate division WOR-3 bacterium]|nr:hypothetical protein [candidate division WOR-3 bacterium]